MLYYNPELQALKLFRAETSDTNTCKLGEQSFYRCRMLLEASSEI